MKRSIGKPAVLLLLLCLLISCIGIAAAESERPASVAHRLPQGIVPDGKLDEWNLDDPILIREPEQVVRDINMWQGPEDLSASVYVGWDEAYLYLAVDLWEDTPFGALEMLPLDGEDNIELYLSTNPADDPDRKAYATNDFKVFLVMDHQYWDTAIDRSMVGSELRQRFVSQGMQGGENVLEGYECASEYTTTGYIWEAKIPWACFSNKKIPVYQPQVGDTLNFDILFTDIAYACPGTEYIPQIAWTGSLDINTDPSLWGRITLAE